MSSQRQPLLVGRFILLYGSATVAHIVLFVMVARSGHPRTDLLLGALAMSLFVSALLLAFFGLWRPMLADFSAVEPAEDAVRRRFQSFSIGIVNMGYSIHASVDDDYLHLTPLAFWRLFGARPVSIPWSALRRQGRFGRAATLRPVGITIYGPRWCMDLVPDGSSETGNESVSAHSDERPHIP